MNIGLDVDGVLTSLKQFEIETGIIYFKRKPINIKTNNIEKMFNCSKTESNIFWLRNSRNYLLLKNARPFASEITKKLKQENYSINIITCRAKTSSNDIVGSFSRMALKYWLNKENISYDKIFYCNSSKEKRIVCQENNIDIMIDDEIININEISKVTDTILFDDKINIKQDNSFLSLYKEIKNHKKNTSIKKL